MTNHRITPYGTPNFLAAYGELDGAASISNHQGMQ